MRKNQGITLVALIITIIIMLILVAVSVNVIIKSNLIGTAEKAANGYKTAYEQEDGGVIEINGNKYASIEDYAEGKVLKDEVHNWERNGNELKCNHCNTNLTIGDIVNYTATGSGSSSISAQMSGADAEQTINVDPITTWIVLGIEDSNGNGTNESLLLTTAAPTAGKITLGGAAGYNNGIQEINRMCKELYGKDARGITVNDVNNCLTYKPKGGTYINMTGFVYLDNFNTSLKMLLEEEWNSIQKSGAKLPDGTDSAEELGKYILDGYKYEEKDLPSTSTDEAKRLVLLGDYWLASKSTWAYIGRNGENLVGCAQFCLGNAGNTGVSLWNVLFRTWDRDRVKMEAEGSESHGLRPVMPIWDKIPELASEPV